MSDLRLQPYTVHVALHQPSHVPKKHSHGRRVVLLTETTITVLKIHVHTNKL